MPTATIPAIYIDGKIIPKLKPPFAQPDEVMVTFVKYAEAEEDPDEALFRQIEPQYRRIRRQVFKERYPKLYAKYYNCIEHQRVV